MPALSEILTLIRWTVTAADRRQPSTQRELAGRLGVSESALSKWRHLPEYRQFLMIAALHRVESEIPNVLESLLKGAISPGGMRDRQTIVQYLLPALTQARSGKYFELFEEALAAGSNKRLPHSTIHAKLDAFPPEQRQQFIELLEGLGLETSDSDSDQAKEDLPPVIEVERPADTENIIDADSIEDFPGRPKRGRGKYRKVLPQVEGSEEY